MSEGRYRVRWAASAADDIAKIAAYVATDSVESARRLVDRIESAVSALDHHPLRGRRVPELARFGIHAFRELICGPYRIVYRVEGRTVGVLGVFDGRRDLSDLVIERLLPFGRR